MTPAFIVILFHFTKNHDNNFLQKKIPLDEGEGHLEAILGKPDGNGPFPALIMAPGQGYPMERSIFLKLANIFRNEGFITLQFNWRFFTNKTSISEDFTDEILELKTCLAYLRSFPDVKKHQIFVIGKSLGALVGIELAATCPDFRSLVLISVALHPPMGPYEFHPKIEKLREIKVPVYIFSGEKDPICKPEMLKKLVATMPFEVPVMIVPGDHQFKGKDEEETSKNEDFVVNNVFKIILETIQDDKLP
jgi:pimeloyl-ACP methyl ester carboxylesterase